MMRLQPLIIFLVQCANVFAQRGDASLPQQAVMVDPSTFAVLGANGTFRSNSGSMFNPTATPAPFFQVFDEAFLDILGQSPSIHQVAGNSTFAFAHEAPIYNPDTDEVFFASDDGGSLGMSDINHNNQVGKINMKDVETAFAGLGPNDVGTPLKVPVTALSLPDTIQMTNGGTGPYKNNLVLATSGRGSLPPSIALVNPRAPYNATVLLDNFFGRQFNSLNDIKIHPQSGAFFFTDASYGSVNHFRSAPTMPNQVYRLDPSTGVVRVVAADFNKCNGIAFTADGQTAYVLNCIVSSDTSATDAQTNPATIYAFDVDPKTNAFVNRRVFAYSDTGIPDGIQVDSSGNVYSGCGDGVHVWSPTGILLGKFFIGTTSSNMAFAGDGRLVIMAETKVFVAKIAAKQGKVAFP